MDSSGETQQDDGCKTPVFFTTTQIVDLGGTGRFDTVRRNLSGQATAATVRPACFGKRSKGFWSLPWLDI